MEADEGGCEDGCDILFDIRGDGVCKVAEVEGSGSDVGAALGRRVGNGGRLMDLKLELDGIGEEGESSIDNKDFGRVRGGGRGGGARCVELVALDASIEL